MNKILSALTILATILTGVLVYANAQYFPKERGVVIEQRLDSLSKDINKKLDLLVMRSK